MKLFLNSGRPNHWVTGLIICLLGVTGCQKQPTEGEETEAAGLPGIGQEIVESGAAEQGLADDSLPGTDDAAGRAWQALQDATESPLPPEEWADTPPTQEELEEWRAENLVKARTAAQLAREFQSQFAEDPRAAQAKVLERHLVEVQVRLGDETAAEQLDVLEGSIAQDENVPEILRLESAIRALHRTTMEQADQEAQTRVFTQGAMELAEKYPNIPEVNQSLVQALDLNYETGNPEKQATLMAHLEGFSDGQIAADATDLQAYRYNIEAANVAARYGDFENTERILNKIKVDSTPEQIIQVCAQVESQMQKEKTKRELVGQPLDLKFTALDGREVDVASMKGQVLLIDFWATWCGPCIAELPNVKVAYEKFHAQGFEILGISFDEKKEALEQFVEKQEMTWPQYFDGKGWNNDFGQKYGIGSIPTMWLVNKQGVLVDLKAREDLAEKVEKLLAE